MSDVSLPLAVARKIWSVGDLTAQMREVIEGLFPDVWVEGEVSGLKVAGSGHCYFTLKDAEAQIRSVLFRGGGRFLKFILKEGQTVRVRGHLTLYAPRGEYQLVVDSVEPAGVGALQAAFEVLKAQLRSEGLFDAERKTPIPRFPRTVILITSPTGAVIHDMLSVLRPLPVQIQIAPVPVQGEGAAAAIAHAITQADQTGADLLIVARGGGSLEDLWAFNEEAVARAIARCSTPIISAVGHETDVTLADFVADLRAPTPSLAAEEVARSVRLVLSRFSQAQADLHARMRWQMETRRNRMHAAARGLISPLQRLLHQRDRAAHLAWRMASRMRHRLVLWRERLRHGAARMNDLSPLAVLGRGYSLTRKRLDLAVVRSADQVAAGDRLQLTLHHGTILCTVDAEGSSIRTATE